MRPNKYYLAAFSAFFIWGFFSLALKPLQDYPSLDILFYRVFFSVVLMVFVNVAFRHSVMRQNWNQFMSMTPKERQRTTFLTLGGAVLLCFNWFIFIFVMNHVSVKAASLAYLICPILTTVLAFFILKEKLGKWQWMAVLLSFFSCVLLALGHFEDIFYSFITAMSYAMYLISQRKNSGLDKFLVLTIQLTFTAFILLPFYPKYSGALPVEPLFYVDMLVIVVLFTIVPLFLNLYALKGINSSAVGIMIYMNPIIGFLLAIFYYKEDVNMLQLGSYFLILVSIVVFNEKLFFSVKPKEMPSKVERSKQF